MLVGLWMYYEISAQYDQASELGLRMVRIAESGQAPEHLFQGHYSLGFTLFYQGKYEEAKTHFEQAINSEIEGHDYSKQSATADDTRTHVRCVLAQACWHLGLPETADRYAGEAIDLARSLKQPYAITFTSYMNGWLHTFRREPEVTAAYAKECLSLAQEHGYRFFVILGKIIEAWSQPALSENEVDASSAAVDQQSVASGLSAALDAFEKGGATAGFSCWLFQLAEVWLQEGKPEEALAALERGWQHLNNHGERILAAEYYRLHAGLCMLGFNQSRSDTDLDAAIEYLETALSTAREMKSRALELRAATDMAELKILKGQSGEAKSLLDSVIQSFPEFDESGDCVRAREVLRKAT